MVFVSSLVLDGGTAGPGWVVAAGDDVNSIVEHHGISISALPKSRVGSFLSGHLSSYKVPAATT